MINLAAPILLTLLIGKPDAEFKEYKNKALDLRLQLPVSWKVQERKDSTIMLFPVTDGMAQIELRATPFKQPAEDWQKLQNQVNTDSQRAVLRQWDEDLLGSKLLLTEVDAKTSKILVGLHYTSGAKKLHFSLKSPSNGFDEAVNMWRGTLQSLRSIGVGQDESVADSGTSAVIIGANAERKPTFGPQKMPMTVANREMTLRFPAGWKVSEKAPYTISNVKTGLVVNLDIRNVIDSPVPGELLMAIVNEDLKNFETVSSRVNNGPIANRSGALTFSVTRVGMKEGKGLASFASVGEKGGFYYVLTFTAAQSGKEWEASFKQLVQLNEQLGIEPKI